MKEFVGGCCKGEEDEQKTGSTQASEPLRMEAQSRPQDQRNGIVQITNSNQEKKKCKIYHGNYY
uniref:Uncharacterized protein n=1 Tax=Rhizophora mucronata TaxID=61149 RepID=A0A2P2M4A4_RHIMU